jgi:hypothetical protein
MAATVKYEGIGTRAGKLVVFLTLNVGGAKRFSEVVINAREFTHDEVLYEINTAAAKRLRETWESEKPPWDVDLPLPGIG